MAGDVLSLATARTSPSPRLAARFEASRIAREERTRRGRELRARWERDLATWPAAFHEPVRKLLSRINPRRIDEDRAADEQVATRRLLEQLHTVHFNAACARAAARFDGDRRYRRAEMAEAAADLLVELWRLGVRKLDTSALRRDAALLAWNDRASLLRRASAREAEAARLRADLERWTALTGRSRGRAFGPRVRAAMATELETAEQVAAECRADLAGLEDPDPLRAFLVTGCQARARRIYS